MRFHMTTVKAGGVLSVLCTLSLLVHATHSAEAPAIKAYEFELQTLNLGDAVRRKQIEFTVDDAMSDDELAAVIAILDELGASQPDAAGYRSLSMSNGTRARI